MGERLVDIAESSLKIANQKQCNVNAWQILVDLGITGPPKLSGC